MKTKRKIVTAVLILALAVSALALPVSAASSCDAVVTASSLPVRTGAGSGYGVLATAPRGAALTVIGVAVDDGSWYKVNYGGVIGYMDSTYVQSASSSAAAEAIASAATEAAGGQSAPAVTEPATATDTPVTESVPEPTVAANDASNLLLYPSGDANATVSGDLVRFRSTPGGDILGNFSNGARILVTAVSGSWYEVNCNGTLGYVHSSYAIRDGETVQQPAAEQPVVEQPVAQPEPTVAPAPPAANYSVGQQIVNTAMQYQGVPYVWGGTSPSGFDCSGLCYYVYQQCGYSINRVADSIYTGSGYSVSYDQLAPGDIVCFGNSGYVWHVGIYIGNNQFIHSPYSGAAVRVESLSGTYSSNFVCGKRIA